MTTEDEIRFLILSLQREGNRQLAQALSPASITPSQAEVISILFQYGALSLKDLGRLLVCETGESPSRLVDRLVAIDLVRKVKSELDGRGVILSLTDKGNQAFREVIAPVEASIRSQIQVALSPSDLKKLHTLLFRFGKATGSIEALRAREKLNKSHN